MSRQAKTFGRDVDSLDYWEKEAAAYQGDIDRSRAEYHRGRLLTAERLLNKATLQKGSRVLDFGCGDGAFTRLLQERGLQARGLDIAEAMVELARSRSAESGSAATYSVGGATELAGFETDSLDAVVSLNVLAYLTDEELEAFWRGLGRAARRGGWFLVSHSNELFDLFSLNQGTASFFAANFTGGESIESLLRGDAQQNPTYNVRANPLNYGDELRSWGFEEVASSYFNFHPLPPSLLGDGDTGRVVDPDQIERIEPWRLMFQCSTYFSLSRRI